MPRKRQRGKLSPEKEALATAYIPLALTLARPFKLNWYLNSDEFESAALFALVEAAESYDERRGVKFSTFARPRILGSLFDTKKSLLKRKRHDGTSIPLRDAFQLLGKLVVEEPQTPLIDSKDLLEFWFSCLPKVQALICRHIYLDGGNQNSASRMLGVAKSHVSMQHSKALAELVKHPSLMQLAIEMNYVESSEGWHDAGAEAKRRSVG